MAVAASLISEEPCSAEVFRNASTVRFGAKDVRLTSSDSSNNNNNNNNGNAIEEPAAYRKSHHHHHYSRQSHLEEESGAGDGGGEDNAEKGVSGINLAEVLEQFQDRLNSRIAEAINQECASLRWNCGGVGNFSYLDSSDSKKPRKTTVYDGGKAGKSIYSRSTSSSQFSIPAAFRMTEQFEDFAEIRKTRSRPTSPVHHRFSNPELLGETSPGGRLLQLHQEGSQLLFSSSARATTTTASASPESPGARVTLATIGQLGSNSSSTDTAPPSNGSGTTVQEGAPVVAFEGNNHSSNSNINNSSNNNKTNSGSTSSNHPLSTPAAMAVNDSFLSAAASEAQPPEDSTCSLSNNNNNNNNSSSSHRRPKIVTMVAAPSSQGGVAEDSEESDSFNINYSSNNHSNRNSLSLINGNNNNSNSGRSSLNSASKPARTSTRRRQSEQGQIFSGGRSSFIAQSRASFRSVTPDSCQPTMETDALPAETFDDNQFLVLQRVIHMAKSGKATRRGVLQDQRSFWHRYRDVIGEWMLSVVILMNTATIGLSSDLSPDWFGWVVIDGVFAFIFLAAMLSKMYSWGLRKYFSKELYWNLFEVIVVVMAVAELLVNVLSSAFEGNSNIALLRILRLTRVVRIVRICRLQIFADLSMMINGALGSAKTLIWSIILITLPVYGVALLFRESLTRSSAVYEEHFSSMVLSFFTVFRCLVAFECTTEHGEPIFVLVAKEQTWWLAAIYSLVLVLMTFGLYNVIVSIYVENIVAAAKYNDLHQKRQRFLDAQVFAEKITKLVEFIFRVHKSRKTPPSVEVAPVSEVNSEASSIDLEDLASIEITPEFFDHLRSFREFQDLMSDLDIADEDQLDLFDTLDVDRSGTLDIQELVFGICKLRGPAKRSDIIGVDFLVRSVQSTLLTMNDAVLEELSSINHSLRRLRQSPKIAGIGGGNGPVSQQKEAATSPSPTNTSRNTRLHEPQLGRALV